MATSNNWLDIKAPSYFKDYTIEKFADLNIIFSLFKLRRLKNIFDQLSDFNKSSADNELLKMFTEPNRSNINC